LGETEKRGRLDKLEIYKEGVNMTITPRPIMLPIRDKPFGAIVDRMVFKQIAEVSEMANDENGDTWYKTPLGWVMAKFCRII
jgi:hypothetical protein